jgi:SAM-dependent methyltransferase
MTAPIARSIVDTDNLRVNGWNTRIMLILSAEGLLRMETKMESQLALIGKSYDKAIELGGRGIDLYECLPVHIKNDPDYPIYQEMIIKGGDSGSGRKEIKDYLSPDTNMRFIDLGCCLNLMFRGYDTWPSIYHGVDISGKTIALLDAFVKKNKLPIGSLYCGSIHETPFDDNYFDIGACIGVLEYFEKDFVTEAIVEAHRIIKPRGRFILDIPCMGSPECRIMMMIEEHLGRPDQFDMSAEAFEDILQDYFEIEKKEKAGPMIEYFLRCKD